MKLYIIRHGETKWNTEARLQGASDIPLNENGVSLARVTGQALRHIVFSAIYSSPLVRARQTAELVTEGRKIPVVIDKRLQEITFGVWEGLSCHRDHYEIPSDSFRDFFERPFEYQPPTDGESILSLCARCADFLEDLVQKHGEEESTFLISTHGCTLRGLMNYIYDHSDADLSGAASFDRSIDFWHGHVPPNCSVSIAEYQHGKWNVLAEDNVYYGEESVR